MWRVEFTPYWLLMIDADVPFAESAVPMLMVEEPNEGHLSYDTRYADPTTGSSFAPGYTGQPFTPTAILAHDYLETASTDNTGALILRATKPDGTTQELRIDDLLAGPAEVRR